MWLRGKIITIGRGNITKVCCHQCKFSFFFFFIFFEAEVEIFLKCNLYLTDENKYLAVLMIKKFYSDISSNSVIT